MNNLRVILTMTLACSALTLQGLGQKANQKAESKVLDGAYYRDDYLKRVIPYPHLREADVMYKKRVWQIIDLTQKFNHPFYYPQEPINNRKNLIDLIVEGLYPDQYGNINLVAYSPGADKQDDEFTVVLTVEGLDTVLYETVESPTFDQITGLQTGTELKKEPINYELITRYQIKEEWIWDKQRSERYIRIIGIAPMIQEYDNIGNPAGYAPLFWLHYGNQTRRWFAGENAEVFNVFNDAQRRTFEDLFQKRYFSSYIIKEGNAFDRPVAKYETGLGRLAESERIQQELFNLEHDLWHY